jgi:hypothetical protein
MVMMWYRKRGANGYGFGNCRAGSCHYLGVDRGWNTFNNDLEGKTRLAKSDIHTPMEAKDFNGYTEYTHLCSKGSLTHKWG